MFSHSRGGVLAAASLLCVASSLATEPSTAAAAAWQHFAAQSHRELQRINGTGNPPAAVDDSVAEIKFSEFFGPIGERGLEYSPQLRALDGKKVRITGFMVREQVHARGVSMLAPRPMSVETTGLCYYDDLPPSVVHLVIAPASSSAARLPFLPGRLAVVGTLQIGSHLEADGRNSCVRLLLDSTEFDSLTGKLNPGSSPAGTTVAAAK